MEFDLQDQKIKANLQDCKEIMADCKKNVGDCKKTCSDIKEMLKKMLATMQILEHERIGLSFRSFDATDKVDPGDVNVPTKSSMALANEDGNNVHDDPLDSYQDGVSLYKVPEAASSSWTDLGKKITLSDHAITLTKLQGRTDDVMENSTSLNLQSLSSTEDAYPPHILQYDSISFEESPALLHVTDEKNENSTDHEIEAEGKKSHSLLELVGDASHLIVTPGILSEDVSSSGSIHVNHVLQSEPSYPQDATVDEQLKEECIQDLLLNSETICAGKATKDQLENEDEEVPALHGRAFLPHTNSEHQGLEYTAAEEMINQVMEAKGDHVDFPGLFSQPKILNGETSITFDNCGSSKILEDKDFSRGRH